MINLLATSVEVYSIIFALTIILGVTFTALMLFFRSNKEETKKCECEECGDDCPCKTEGGCNCNENCNCGEDLTEEEKEIVELYNALTMDSTVKSKPEIEAKEEQVEEDVKKVEHYTEETITRAVLLDTLRAAGVKGITKASKAELLTKFKEMGLEYPAK